MEKSKFEPHQRYSNQNILATVQAGLGTPREPRAIEFVIFLQYITSTLIHFVS